MESWLERPLPFCVGNDLDGAFAADFAGWVDYLKREHFRSAYLWIDPTDSVDLHQINMLAFAGNVRWAPVTVSERWQLIWHERFIYSTSEPRRIESTFRGGFRILSGQERLRATVEESVNELSVVLPRLIDFQHKYRPGEPFDQPFLSGMAVLKGDAKWSDSVDLLFPEGIYPESSYRLVGTVSEAWAFGGMGWWNDWVPPEAPVKAAFEELTLAYYKASMKALAAACDAIVPPG